MRKTIAYAAEQRLYLAENNIEWAIRGSPRFPAGGRSPEVYFDSLVREFPECSNLELICAWVLDLPWLRAWGAGETLVDAQKAVYHEPRYV